MPRDIRFIPDKDCSCVGALAATALCAARITARSVLRDPERKSVPRSAAEAALRRGSREIDGRRRLARHPGVTEPVHRGPFGIVRIGSPKESRIEDRRPRGIDLGDERIATARRCKGRST
jgi:hypothetical protein